MRGALMVAVAGVLVAAPAVAQSERFAFEYRVERAAAAKLSIPACMATAQRAVDELGMQVAMRNVTPGKLGVLAAGPRGGGSSLIVYCIGVDAKTAYVVQAIDYARPQSPAARHAADTVHQALLRAGR